MAHIESKTTITLTETTDCATGTGDTLRVVPLPRGHIPKDGWRLATPDDVKAKALEEKVRKAKEAKEAEAARPAATSTPPAASSAPTKAAPTETQSPDKSSPK